MCRLTFLAPMEFGCHDKDSGEVECYLEIPNPEAVGCVERFATFLSFLLVVITFPFSLFECFKVVQEFERAVIFRLGRVRKGGARGPGLFFVLPCIDTYRKVDLRTVSFDVPPQEVLTRDSVTVAVDAVVYYRIKEPLNAVVRVADYSASTRLLAATTLRNVLGMRDLAQLLSDREAISHMMQANLDEATDPWGVEVERVEIKDVRLPVQLQRAMAAEAEADREARAKIIAAEGEIKASKALREASLVMVDNPMALQILTKDSVTVIVNAVVYCHVQKPLLCILNVDYYLNATELTAVSILRNIMGQYTLTELLSNRINISRTARAEIDNVTNEWGVTTERIEIKDVILPCELQKAMAAEAEGTRIAKAKIIEAQGEIKAAENLRDASRIMVDNPQIMLLRYLQTLNYIASQQQTSIIFPFPLDLPEPPKSSNYR